MGMLAIVSKSKAGNQEDLHNNEKDIMEDTIYPNLDICLN